MRQTAYPSVPASNIWLKKDKDRPRCCVYLFPLDLDTALANHHSSKQAPTCDALHRLPAGGAAGGVHAAPRRARAAPGCLEGAARLDALGQMWLSGRWQHKLVLKVQHAGLRPWMQQSGADREPHN